jgi:hypothetical protein
MANKTIQMVWIFFNRAWTGELSNDFGCIVFSSVWGWVGGGGWKE